MRAEEFKRRRQAHFKLVAAIAGFYILVFVPLALAVLFMDPLSHVFSGLAAIPFIVLIYLRIRMRFEQGYQNTGGAGESYRFSYHHQGGSFRETLQSQWIGIRNDLLEGRMGCYTTLMLLWIFAMLAVCALMFPPVLLGGAMFFGALAALKMMGWYLRFEPVTAMRTAIYKAKEQRAAQMIHVRGAKVIEAPEASTTSPIVPGL